jgi:MFS transporter, ACS family, D-galactonate transporter
MSLAPLEARDADAIDPDERPSVVRYQVVALLTLAAAISYLPRIAVGVAESSIRDDLQLSLRESGWFMGAFFWSYALLQVPGGVLAQRRGTRFTLTLLAVCWSLAALGIASAQWLWMLLAAQLVMGAAQAGLFPAACYSISHWVPLARRSISCAFLSTGMQVGAISASLLTGALILLMGWRWVFVCYAVPGVVWAVLFLLRFRDDPNDDPSVNQSERRLIGHVSTPPSTPNGPPRSTPWRAIFRSRSVWFLCGQQMCRAAGYMFFASWFPTFLQESRGVSVKDSGYLQALVFSGALIGGLCGGLLIDWLWRTTGSLRLSRSGVGTTFLLCCSGLLLAAWFVDHTFVAVGLLAAGVMSSSLCGPCAYSAAIDIGGSHVPQVFGLMNMAGNLATAVCPILVAELFKRTDNWGIVLVVFAAIYAVGAICWALVDAGRRIPD